MNTALNLFGEPIDLDDFPARIDNKKRKSAANGYAADPGTGPAGQTCGSCRHSIKRGKFWKCKLAAKVKVLPNGSRIGDWSRCISSDIRLKSPACKLWTSDSQKDPDGRKL